MNLDPQVPECRWGGPHRPSSDPVSKSKRLVGDEHLTRVFSCNLPAQRSKQDYIKIATTSLRGSKLHVELVWLWLS